MEPSSTPTYFFMVWCLIKHGIHISGMIIKHRDVFFYYMNNTKLCIIQNYIILKVFAKIQ